MPHTKTPGGQQPAESFLKEDAKAKGLGADNAPGHTEGQNFSQTPAANNSGDSNIGITAIHGNNPKSGFAEGSDGTVRTAGAPMENVPQEHVDPLNEQQREQREP